MIHSWCGFAFFFKFYFDNSAFANYLQKTMHSIYFYNQNIFLDPSTSLFTRLPVDSSRATYSSVTVHKIFVIISVWDLHFVSLGCSPCFHGNFFLAGFRALSYRSLPHDTHKFSLNNTWLDVHTVEFEEGIANSSFSPTSITLLTFPMKSSFFCTFMALAGLTPEEICLCPLLEDFLYTETIVMGRV